MNIKCLAVCLIWAFAINAQIVSQKELLITNLSVVNSEEARTGVWSFGQFMKFLSGPNVDASLFTESWLTNWATDSIVNGKVAPGRPKVLEFLRTWDRHPNGRLNLEKAPFVLNAIINRIDLGTSKINSETAELRFVFQALDANQKTTRMMVIFEFRVPYTHKNRPGLVQWAKSWHKLASIPFGPQYNASLARITNQVFKLSTLNELAEFRLRTGDGIFSRPPEMRSFCVHPRRIGLRVCQSLHTPSIEFATPTMGDNPIMLSHWIQTNVNNILNESYSLPKEFLGTHYPIGDFKWAKDLENSPYPKMRLGRERFSRNACNGCHNMLETKSVVMIGDRSNISQESKLAPFVLLDLENRKKIVQMLLGK